MRTIWKFPLGRHEIQGIGFPIGSKILSAGLDPKGDLCIWVEVDPDEKEKSGCAIFIQGTGNPMHDDLESGKGQFIDTVREGDFMWHIYARYK